MTKMTLSEELTWRGFINQTTLEDIKRLDSGNFKFYNGYDASVDSLTIGNLAAVMMDKLFVRHGVEGVLIAGGATSLIGDPGGKDKERPLQSVDTIQENVSKVRKQLESLIGEGTKLLNNLDWLGELKYLEFLRDFGKYFSMTTMVQRDYIANRIGPEGAGISYTEFSYTLLQGYDFLHLFKEYGINLQLAGSDQWGNGLSGVELIKKLEGKDAHILTCPLIVNKATGKKFGKSEVGAVWLDPSKTSPLKFYQFWMNTDDEGSEEYLKIFTELDKPAIDDLIAQHKKEPSARTAQIRLAYEVTKIVHGEEIAKQAEKITNIITGKLSVDSLSDDVIDEARANMPNLRVKADYPIEDILVKTELASSKTEAKRLLASKAVYINGNTTLNENIKSEDFINGRLLLRRGKAFKDTALIELE